MSKYILGHRAQTRADALRYTVWTGCVLILVAVLQVSVLARMRPFGAVPDLMLCTVLCCSYFGGRYMGGIVGIAGGFLIGAMGSISWLCLFPLCFFFLGYLTGYYVKVLNQSGYLSYLVYLGVALLLRVILTTVDTYVQFFRVDVGQLIFHTLLPEVIGTAALGCVIYFPMLLFFGALEKRKR